MHCNIRLSNNEIHDIVSSAGGGLALRHTQEDEEVE